MGCDQIEVEDFKVVRQLDKKRTSIYRSFLLRSSNDDNEYVYKSVNITALKKKEKDAMLNEINVLKKLSHANIIEIKNDYYFKDNKFLNIITEYAEEGTLQNKYEEQKKKKEYFDENELLDWFIQILLALKYIHEKNILHRDINPSNIFLMKDMAKLGNFGVAKALSPELNYAKTLVTTPQYLAPEVKEKEKYTCQADIWALGVTFYQLIILDYPFEGSLEEIQTNIEKGNKKPIPKDCKIDKKFIKIINEMMIVDPEKRITLEKILEDSIIKSRIECYLIQQKFNKLEAKKTIRAFEDEEKGRKKKVPIVQEEEKETEVNETEEQKEKKEKEIQERKEKKANYDKCRHMSALIEMVNIKI